MSVRISQIAAVLADLTYPAAKWQVLAEADYYGANFEVRALLWALPLGRYDSFDTVRAALLGQSGTPPEIP
jgi:hypothetical protein